MAAEVDADEMEVIVGTYEEFLVGYKLKHSPEDNKYSLTQSFTNHSHSGSIRAVATVGKFLASGSADEAIRLINMGLRVEHGYLQEQSGTITCLRNYGSKYLFSGCQDGTICIWKSGSWICEKTLIAHRGGVTDISVHPSGKLALSVGADRSLKTWNLIKGRTGFVTNLHGVGDVVRWSPEGDFYAVGICNRVDIYSVQTAKVVYSIPFGKRASSICFINENILVIAGDKNTVEIHDIKKSEKLTEFTAHTVRVKGMLYVEENKILVTGSNCDEFLKFWRFPNENYSKEPKLLAEVNTTCRITCLIAWSKNIAKAQTEIAKPEPSTSKVLKESPKSKTSKVNPKKSKAIETKATVQEESDNDNEDESSDADDNEIEDDIDDDEEVKDKEAEEEEVEDKEAEEDESEEEIVVKPKPVKSKPKTKKSNPKLLKISSKTKTVQSTKNTRSTVKSKPPTKVKVTPTATSNKKSLKRTKNESSQPPTKKKLRTK